MAEGSIGRRYARALALALAEDPAYTHNSLDRAASELETLAHLYDTRGDFYFAMSNPAVRLDERKAIVEEIAHAHDYQPATRSLLQMLVERDRFSFLSTISKAFHNEVDTRLGRVRAQVSSAKPLPEIEAKNIVAALEKRTGKSVLATFSVDTNLIAGISTRIGGTVIDGTVRAQLNQLRQQLGS